MSVSVTGSSSLQFKRLFLHLPICNRRRLRVFQVRFCRKFFFGFQVGPLFTTLYLQLQFQDIKWFLYFGLATGSSYPYHVCLVPVHFLFPHSIAQHSTARALLLICGGAIPASMYSWSRVDSFKQRIIKVNLSFSTWSRRQSSRAQESRNVGHSGLGTSGYLLIYGGCHSIWFLQVRAQYSVTSN